MQRGLRGMVHKYLYICSSYNYSIVAWNQSSGSGTGFTLLSYTPGCSLRSRICPANTLMSPAKAAKFKDLHVPMRAARAKENNTWLVCSDVTGYLGERVAYGSTAVINPDGIIIAQMPYLETGLLLHSIPSPS